MQAPYRWRCVFVAHVIVDIRTGKKSDWTLKRTITVKLWGVLCSALFLLKTCLAYVIPFYTSYMMQDKHDSKCLCNKLCRVLRKLGIMHVRKVSSQISLCSPHRLIRDDTFRLNWIYAKKRQHLNEKIPWTRKLSSLISLCALHRLIWFDNLRTSILPSFLRTQLIYSETLEEGVMALVQISVRSFFLLKPIYS